MAEQSGFFDAHLINGAYDRVYLAENFAKYFASFIGNGVFGGKSSELMVQQKAVSDMSIRVLPGQAWINGYWYENDDELSLAVDVADGVLSRIDVIVLRWDNTERVIRLAIKKGAASSVAYPPSILRNADFYELKLAEIHVKAGATKITQADIVDTRLNNDVCGFVHGLIQQFDTTEFGKQIDSFIENFEVSTKADVRALINRINALINADMATALTRDVATLKDDVAGIAIESEDYVGCFYRVSQGIVEWLNPPSQYGVEYRTVERWQNKAVYQKTLYVASLPNNSIVGIEVDSAYTAVVSISGYALDTDNNYYHPFPIVVSGVTPIAVISGFEGDGGDGGTIVLRTNTDARSYQAYITIKYTKD